MVNSDLKASFCILHFALFTFHFEVILFLCVLCAFVPLWLIRSFHQAGDVEAVGCIAVRIQIALFDNGELRMLH